MSQKEAILEYLMSGQTLTPIEALEQFGCFRLGARIWDLKQEGYDIDSEIISNEGKRYCRYKLRQSPVQLELFGGKY